MDVIGGEWWDGRVCGGRVMWAGLERRNDGVVDEVRDRGWRSIEVSRDGGADEQWDGGAEWVVDGETEGGGVVVGVVGRRARDVRECVGSDRLWRTDGMGNGMWRDREWAAERGTVLGVVEVLHRSCE